MKKTVMILAMVMGLYLVLLPAGQASAASLFTNAKNNACQGVDSTQVACPTSNTDQVGNIVRSVTNILSIIVGVAAVIMIIVGGFKYITSGGDSSKTGTAKNTIIYALIGLVIVGLAQLIVNVVITTSNKVATPASGSSSTTTGP